MSQYKAITKLLGANVGAKRMHLVFDDFTEMFALAFRNGVDLRGREAREERYLQIAGQYSRDQLSRFAEAFGLIVKEMESDPSDVLGRLYMELELGNEHLGQFYTPMGVSKLLAGMNLDSIVQQVEDRGFAEVYEPACGAAAFMIAMAIEMRRIGLNYQTQLHVTAEDISAQAVHMAYLHMSLLHIPAVIYRRNTLTMETFDAWYTPAHILNGWDWKLPRGDRSEESQETVAEVKPPTAISAPDWESVFGEVAS